MKALSAFLLLLPSANFRIASGAEIRGGLGVEDETLQEHPKHDLAEADEHPNASEKSIAEEYNLSIKDAAVKAIAEEYNISIKDAKEVREVRSDFRKLVDDVFDDVNFLQAEMPEELNGPFVLKFKNGKVPEQGQDGIKKFRVKNQNAKLEIVHSRLSLQEAEERGDRFLDKLKSKGHLDAQYTIDGDDLDVWAAKPMRRSLGEAEGEEDVLAEGEEDVLLSLSRTAEILDLDHDHRDLEGVELHLYENRDEGPANEGPANARQGEDATDLTHERPDARRLDSDYYDAFGGIRIHPKDSRDACTSGFVVQRKHHPKLCGIVTAGHCDDMLLMDSNEFNKDSAIELYKYTQADPDNLVTDPCSTTEWGEYCWYYFDGNHRARNEIVNDEGDRRYIHRTARGISKGDDLWGYSRTKGAKIRMKVKRTSGSAMISNWYGRPWRVKKVAVMGPQPDYWNGEDIFWDYYINRGDSGGPWWDDDGNAHGVTAGAWPKKCDPAENKYCIFFSRLKHLDRVGMGIEVVTEDDPNCAWKGIDN